MMISEELMNALVEKAKRIEEFYDLKTLLNYEHFASPCGCLGPQDGQPLCQCQMSSELDKKLPFVLDRMGYKEEATKVMRKRIVSVLSGN